MAFSKIVFITWIICLFYLVDLVSTLSKEAILGGTFAPKFIFTYQVSIQGIQNNSLEYTQFGSGAIISDKHVVTTANIFLKINGELKERRFSVVAGSIDLNSPEAFRVDILCLFIPSFDPSFIIFNIAVAKLEDGLGIGKNPMVSKVKLPNAGDVFGNTEATVSGFGLIKMEKEIDLFTGFKITGLLAPSLTFRNVIILADDNCTKSYSEQVAVTNMCGKMLKRYFNEIAGVCWGDTGNPLVRKGVLVGILSNITPDCNNIDMGALYMKVSSFVFNILNFIDGIVPYNAFVRFNRVYIPPMIVHACNQ